MASGNKERLGYGKLLEAWEAPKEAGAPVGCIATSYTFSPAFFEEECLGRFLGLSTDPTQDGPLYLIEREEKLFQVVCAAAIIDKNYCKGTRSLRWDLIPVRAPGITLHSKISLLCWSNWTRIIIGSANLTEDGFRRNQEIFGVLDYSESHDSPLAVLHEIVGFLRDITNYSNTANSKDPSLDRVNKLLDRAEAIPETWRANNRKDRGGVAVRSLLVAPGRPDAFEQLTSLWPESKRANLAIVISPFFDAPENRNLPTEEIWRFLRRRGESGVRYGITAEKIPGEEFHYIHAPKSLYNSFPHGRQDVWIEFYNIELEKLEANRPLHAKSYWFESDKWIAFMIGSSNFTSAGLGLADRPNLEANLIYLVDKKKNPKEGKKLSKALLLGNTIEITENDKWQPRFDNNQLPNEFVPLPLAFGWASYDVDDNLKGMLKLTFTKSPPAGWRLYPEETDIAFYSEKEWKSDGSPMEADVTWSHGRPPSGFNVAWDDLAGLAWWPVNIVSGQSLPPPDELKNLSLEILISVLTSARPLYRVLDEYLKRQADDTKHPNHSQLLDPHKRVDVSRFLLQRTRRVSWALNALRERIELPAASEKVIQWRFHGPVGVKAVADALMREAASIEERAFLLSELALELHRAQPQTAPGYLPIKKVRDEINAMIEEISNLVPHTQLKEIKNLRDYVRKVFRTVLEQR